MKEQKSIDNNSMNPYEVLQVSRNASKDEIKKAYRKLALNHHPDRGGQEEKFKEISEAYNILSDDTSRQFYDATGQTKRQGGGPQPNSNPFDFFSSMFGGFSNGGPFNVNINMGPQKPKQQQHPDLVVNVPLSFDEAFTGVKKEVKYTRLIRCSCTSMCQACQGQGVIFQSLNIAMKIQTPCIPCRGQGFSSNPSSGSCDLCQDTYNKHEEKVQMVDVPPGIGSSTLFVVEGGGNMGGKLLMKFSFQTPDHFEKRDLDLVYHHKLSWRDSILGTTIAIPHPAVKDLQFDTTQLGPIQENSVHIVGPHGYKSSVNAKQGKLMVQFSIIDIPKPLSEEVRTKLQSII
jgi:DnaJ family protein A protein 2